MNRPEDLLIYDIEKDNISPDAEIEFISRETARILDLDIAGIDLLFDTDGFKVCEANSAPGFMGFETYCKDDMAKSIVDYINFRIS